MSTTTDFGLSKRLLLSLHLLVLMLCGPALAQQGGEQPVPGGRTGAPPAEEPKEVPGRAIAVIARAKADTILLRWGPTDAATWKETVRSGFLIRRTTLLRDGQVPPQPEVRVLTREPLKPLPLEAWEPVATKDKYAAIAAQALYGDTFETTDSFGEDPFIIYERSKEEEQRYAFALFAADQSLETAEALGLYYADATVKANEKYVYEVYPAVPLDPEVDTGRVFTGPADARPLPAPQNVDAEFDDRTVLLSWEIRHLEEVYTGYRVERSEDGVHFQSVTEDPIVQLGQDVEVLGGLMFRQDSLPQNNKTYYYRIRGVTPFAETGPPSDTLRGEGYVALEGNPSITENEVLEDGTVRLRWELPDTMQAGVEGFVMQRAEKADGIYRPLHADSLSATAREFIDREPLSGNYYRVMAFGAGDPGVAKQAWSLPVFVQPVDSVPPAAPEGLQGLVDSNGVVQVTWTGNTEPDLLGYRVFRSNYANEEYSQITTQLLLENRFVDTVSIGTLTGTVFYKIVAVDKRYNNSAQSEPLKLVRPDTRPPVRPVFTGYELKADSGVRLTWHYSSSADVARHELYRSEEGGPWQLLTTEEERDSVGRFVDTEARPGLDCRYKVVATDSAGLSAETDPLLEVALPGPAGNAVIDRFRGQADRLNRQVILKWRYTGPEAESFRLYRAEKGEKLRLLKVLSGADRDYTDARLTVNTEYEYALQVEDKEGNLLEPVPITVVY